MASQKALREWCAVTCASYPDVEIRNMSTSFRDGLAFCAIIHKHRPDLIDFSSLSRENVYQNNKLAFGIAEMKLGIPALLDPDDMVSSKVPDSLSIITYLSQYYHFFNRKPCAGLTGLRPSCSAVLNNLTKTKPPDHLRPCESSADLQTCRDGRLSTTRPRTACHLCFKPVHLIQRLLIDGKIFHRSCFRCTVCHSTLLPGSYTQGSDAGSLICTHHTTDSRSTHPDIIQQVGSAENRPKCTFQEGYCSLGGLTITSVPHYTKETETQDKPVCKTINMDGKEQQELNREMKGSESPVGLQSGVKDQEPPRLPPPAVEGPSPILEDGSAQQEGTKTQEPAELFSPASTDGTGRPVPAPRRATGSSVVPVPATRAKSSQTGDSCSSAGGSPASHRITSPKVKTNHPWLTIVHPGPWAQLPPAPAPVPAPRSKSVRPAQRCNRPPAPNPFAEDKTRDKLEEGTKREAGADGTEAAGAAAPSAEAQRHPLPRSLSVPAITAAHCRSSFSPADTTEGNKQDQDMSSQSKLACKENPFDRKPAMPKSKTYQALSPRRATAPGHGFPLIKRKVQTDQNISTEHLDVEMRDLYEQLEAMEKQGVELENNLRDCKNDKEEEQILMEWFALIQSKQILVRRDNELAYLTMQHKLEERQADVEYKLRCLLNKPEVDWCRVDRDQEQQLMDELVSIIEQRNLIIGSLDQDMQREREEDMLLKAMVQNKDLQKEGLKELKKSKGKFRPSKVFKMLNHKAESTKESMTKKSS